VTAEVSDVKQNMPDSLRDGGKHLVELGDEVESAWERLRSTSEGMGDIFGDDLVGGLIGAAYSAIYELASETFSSVTDDFHAFGERLTLVGDNDEENEQNLAKLLSQINDMLDGIGKG
jgi:ADP-heptose:LPS heptosyltransferase